MQNSDRPIKGYIILTNIRPSDTNHDDIYFMIYEIMCAIRL